MVEVTRWRTGSDETGEQPISRSMCVCVFCYVYTGGDNHWTELETPGHLVFWGTPCLWGTVPTVFSLVWSLDQNQGQINQS